MGDEIDFDDLLADAEQEQMYDDDFMDDIEAELAMEAEVRECPDFLYSACLPANRPLCPRQKMP